MIFFHAIFSIFLFFSAQAHADVPAPDGSHSGPASRPEKSPVKPLKKPPVQTETTKVVPTEKTESDSIEIKQAEQPPEVAKKISTLTKSPQKSAVLAPENLIISTPENDSGTHLNLTWSHPDDARHYVMQGSEIIDILGTDARKYKLKVEKFPAAKDKNSAEKMAQKLRIIEVPIKTADEELTGEQVLTQGKEVLTSFAFEKEGELRWSRSVDQQIFSVFRSKSGEQGPWIIAKAELSGKTRTFYDTVTTDPLKDPPQEKYWYMVGTFPMNTKMESSSDLYQELLNYSAISKAATGKTKAALFKTQPGIWLLLFLILAVGAMMFWFTWQSRQGKEMKIRRIPGIDAIEEGVGRATEMGKSVLYVPGIDDLTDIQTIASMLVLGEVSKTIAEYQTDVIVSCCVPIVREVADEVVKAGFYRAGHPDAYNPTSVRFISSEQFAFCAGTNGIMYRQKPATNIYLGRFFAESLILAETGFVNKAIQIAGTAEATQLPFFIAACDYTLIGEELFAVSAYLSKDPRLVSSLKASDWIKVLIVILLAFGVILMTFGNDSILQLFRIS